jgi:hypothetical protein
MPSGKLCRAVSLRDQRYCRAHIRNHRIAERERAHREAMERLGAELDAMNLPELLFTLNRKLDGINSIVRVFPEARLTLVVAINRLNQLADADSAYESAPESDMESDAYPELPSNQLPTTLEGLTPARVNQILANLRESYT